MSLCLLPVLHLLLLHHTLTLDMDVPLLRAAHTLWHYLSRTDCPLLTSSEAFTHKSFLASLSSQQIGIRKSYSPAWSWSRGGVCCHSTPSLSSGSAVARPGSSCDLPLSESVSFPSPSRSSLFLHFYLCYRCCAVVFRPTQMCDGYCRKVPGAIITRHSESEHQPCAAQKLQPKR